MDVMQTIDSDSIDLIYADPPFHTQRDFVAFNDKFDSMDAYLQWLRPKLEECYRVLKSTGSIYVHLDWHAVHYVKVMMDEIFGMKNFQNDIVWCYHGGGTSKRMFKRKHDIILFYSKNNNHTFNPQYKPQSKTEYKKGVPIKTAPVLEDWWSDIPSRGTATQSKEWIGYPTQKPEALLERIIKASSNPGDIVLDPFSGCATCVSVAQKLGRRWIGIDVSPTSCRLMTDRLRKIGYSIGVSDIIDMPQTSDELKEMEPFEFQNWVVQRLGGRQEVHKSGDGGIDGWTFEGNPIQVKQSDSVGRNTVKMLVHDTMRIGKTNGIIVAFSFGKGAYKEAEEAKAQFGIDIELKTVEDMV